MWSIDTASAVVNKNVLFTKMMLFQSLKNEEIQQPKCCCTVVSSSKQLTFFLIVSEDSLNAQGTCNCSKGWMGEACQRRCIHGNPTDNYICECEPCYNGLDCSTLCSNKSSLCVQGECDCGFKGWRGEFCEKRGCPGVDKDCSGHGTCFADTQTCVCDSGWTGEYHIIQVEL